MTLSETAYAKINLALHVRARRTDGYHELETLFAFIDDGDRLTVASSEVFSLAITGPFAAGLSAGEDNLVLRAARLLAERNGVTAGAAFTLDKRLPVASGIGGGSADAAAALQLAVRLWGQDAPHSGIALELGADVPACMASVTARGEGVGEALTTLGDGLAGTPVLLVNPGVAVSTGAIFKAWDGVDRGPLGHGDDLLALAQSARNDLTKPAIALAPVITDVLAALGAQSGVTLARMSGSGATCFALFECATARDAAAAAIATAHPEWWQMTGALR